MCSANCAKKGLSFEMGKGEYNLYLLKIYRKISLFTFSANNKSENELKNHSNFKKGIYSKYNKIFNE